MRGILTGLCASAMLVALVSGCTRIKPDEIGVRTVNIGGDKGIVPEDYETGYHQYLWPFDSWQRFPSTVQRLRFSKELSGPWSQQAEPLQITSADGDRVVMTAEIFFRIAKGQAHVVLQDSGSGDRYRDVVRGMAQDAARVLFGGLRTEAFYNPDSREAVRQQAADVLRKRLAPRGIEVIDMLVETIEFDPNYETLIKQKKLADQRVEVEKAKARAAEQTGKVAKIAAETTARVQRIDKEVESEISRKTTEVNLQMGSLKAEADKYAAGVAADAALYKAQHDADGQRLVKAAEAEGQQRMNEALVGEGGRNIVALEAVRRLNLPDVSFPSVGYEWFNPNDMALRVGAGTEPPAASPKSSGPGK